MTARSLRASVLGLGGALALVATGCGGSKTGASSMSAASLVRSGATAFVSIDSDTGSSQWKQLDSLAQKFPGRALAIIALKAQLAQHGVDYDKDVKPALGPQVDIAVVQGPAPSDTSFAVLTKPDDGGKFEALVKKLNSSGGSGSQAVFRKVGDWYALSETDQMIGRVLAAKGGKTLAGDSSFKDAFGKLPGSALVKAYVNAHQLGTLIKQSGTSYGSAAAAFDKLDFISAALSAESDGIRVHGAAQGSGAGTILGSGDYSSKLLTQAPGDAFAFLTFRGGASLSSAFRALGRPLTSLAGIKPDELAALLENETALWARPGAVIPEFTAILQPKDVNAGLATLDKLARLLARFSSGTFKPGSERTIDFGQFALHYGASNGKIVITSAAGGVGGSGGSGGKLPSSADFKEAKSAAGLPDSTNGFVYIDLKNAIPLIEAFAGLSGSSVPPVVADNLRPLRSLLAWSAGSGNTRTFDAFLEIK